MYKCLLDIDGVLADFVGGALKKCNIEVSPYSKAENLGNWEVLSLIGLEDESAFWASLDADFWANLAIMSDADEIVDICEERFGRKNICLLSSPPPYYATIDYTASLSACIQGKVRWLEQGRLGRYVRENRVLFGAAKEFCAGTVEHVLVDDRDFNAEQFTLHHGSAFLVPRHWNSAHRYHTTSADRLQQFLTGL